MYHGISHSFRVSKYDNEYRFNGVYLRDEWTSISDIGKVYDGKVFTYNEYINVENTYLSLIKQVCSRLKVIEMRISSLEDYSNNCLYQEGFILKGLDAIIDVARDCLREKYWCKLRAPELEFHFGYDYYLYVRSSLDFKQLHYLVNDLGLFIEVKESPYYKTGDGSVVPTDEN